MAGIGKRLERLERALGDSERTQSGRLDEWMVEVADELLAAFDIFERAAAGDELSAGERELVEQAESLPDELPYRTGGTVRIVAVPTSQYVAWAARRFVVSQTE